MKIVKILILILGACLLVSGLTAVYFSWNKYAKVQEYDVQLEVRDYKVVGLNTKNDKLYFGAVSQGGTSYREIKVHNYLEKPVLAVFKIKGDVAHLVYIPENNYILKYNETKKFDVEARTTPETSVGNYTGKLIIYFKNI